MIYFIIVDHRGMVRVILHPKLRKQSSDLINLYSNIYIVFFFLEQVNMKVLQHDQFNPAKLTKQKDIVFRPSRSLEKPRFSSNSKIFTLNKNKEVSLPSLINSLHLFINQDKPIPKNNVKKMIQILNQYQVKNSVIDIYRFSIHRPPQRDLNNNKRLKTQNINEISITVLRNSQRKDTPRIRKVKTRKIQQVTEAQSKQNETQDLQQALQKKISELQDKIETLKGIVERNQKEIKEKQISINQLQAQKQQKKTNIDEILRIRLRVEYQLKSKLNDLKQQMEPTKKKMCQLQSQLVERETEILSLWQCILQQKY